MNAFSVALKLLTVPFNETAGVVTVPCMVQQRDNAGTQQQQRYLDELL
jgi:hypothetical protein